MAYYFERVCSGDTLLTQNTSGILKTWQNYGGKPWFFVADDDTILNVLRYMYVIVHWCGGLEFTIICIW